MNIKFLSKQPLTVVFFGKTGSGKSTTLNKLFGLNLDTDHAIACTKEPQCIIVTRSKLFGLFREQIQVVDMPGIGESIEADENYWEFYEKWIPLANSLVWVTQADTRAYKRDQIFLERLVPLFPDSLRFVIALNKLDAFGGDECSPFDKKENKPSQEQLQLLPQKINDVYQIFKEVLEDTIYFSQKQIVPYTAVHDWGLSNLRTAILTGR